MTVTREELLRRAQELAPVLKERAAQAEQLRRIPDETVKDVVSAGLIRIGTPEKYGGYRVEYDLAFEVGFELGRACGSTAWCYNIWAVHNWWAGHWPERLQEEFFADGPDTLCASGIDPSRAKSEPVDGGLRISGRWSFCSGCDSAAWATLTVPAEGGPLRCMVPRSDYRIDDNWFVSGMRGTGSKDIVIEDALVPAYRTMDAAREGESSFTGWELHQRASYRAPIRVVTGWDLTAPLVGIAQGAVDEFAKVRGGSGSVAMQLRLAESAAEVDTAKALHRRDTAEIIARGERGFNAFNLMDKARYRRDKSYIAKLCVQAVNRLYEASGAHGIFDSSALLRMYRDVNAGSHHAGLSWDVNMEDYGRQALGLEPLPPRAG